MPRKLTILTACPICGSDVWSRPGHLHTYCSRGCASRAAWLINPKRQMNINRVYVRRPVADRFWPRIQKSPTCWIATGEHDAKGYATMAISRGGGPWVTTKLSVVAWWLASGEWPPKGMDVCHTCDTPACARNDPPGTYELAGLQLPRYGHLFLGTTQNNATDMVNKGRAAMGPKSGAYTHPESVRRGELHPGSTLTTELVRSIRLKHAAGQSQKLIADELGLNYSTVHAVVRRQNWSHVES